MKFVYILAILVGFIVSGCSWTERDGAPDRFVDIDSIVDAVPRNEPFSKSGNPDSYSINGKQYFTLDSNVGFTQSGIASWYGTKFHGKLTASGEPYDMYKMTAAHKSLAIPSYVKVDNIENGKSVVVRVNDRGPFVSGRIIDLSYAAAMKLGVDQTGTAKVSIHVLQPANVQPPTDATNERINSQPLSAQVIVPPKRLSPQVEVNRIDGELETTRAQASEYFLQVGSFSNEINAQNLVSKLEIQISAAIQIVPSQTPLGKMYRVRVGPFAQRGEVNKVQDRLIESGLATTQLVVRLP